MSDRFRPISMEQLTDWVFTELEQKDSIFGIPRSAFYVPRATDRYRTEVYGVTLETPFGVAAGPHTQMAQNIVVAWLCGARFLELKTIQTLDELEINKPCIDMEDEGYNVEWSQELKVYESFDEYLRAWVLIHALHRKLGFPGDAPGMVFNMSVGYNLEGMLKPNVQWYFDAMADASGYLPAFVDIVAARCPEVRDVEIPARLSDTITLSTMHGCPPDEIERITTYLMEERGLHSSVKCNPTLLGPEEVRRIVGEELGYRDVPVPDSAFGHDLRYVDAVPMFTRLEQVAAGHGLTFGLKLSNTLEVNNFRTVFERDQMMYMSGRALHAVTTNLARRLSQDFHGRLLLSFAGGADCFNVADLLRSGMRTVTVCSDVLKTGGYLRMLQYMEHVDAAMDAVGAADLADFTARSAVRQETFVGFAEDLSAAAAAGGITVSPERCRALAGRLSGGEAPGAAIGDWAAATSDPGAAARIAGQALALVNLRQYAAAVRRQPRLRKDSIRTDRSKTRRRLHAFDCIEAPCVDECPINQQVPQYMAAVREGDFAGAVAIVREDNPLGAILGRVCDHLCENTCIRTHLDEPLAIRHIKRFIMSHEVEPHTPGAGAPAAARVAIVGAGPAGLAAARDLAEAGFPVTLFEAHPYAGGMVGGAIPAYRIPQPDVDQDLAVLQRLGVEFRFGTMAGRDFTVESLRRDGYRYVFVAVGAQEPKRLGLPGEEADGVLDALEFLRSVREGRPVAVGNRVAVVGAGDTAMDCVRSALRVGGSEVSLVYRRTIDQMPADREEIHAAVAEGVRVVELAIPAALRVEGGKLAGLVCTRTEYRGDRDASGRKIPHDVPGSDFEIPLDTLIVAISQHSVLGFFEGEPPGTTRAGYLETDPVTFETSMAGVYAGGDVAAHGPSSIVKAVADGRAVAAAIIAAEDRATAVSSAQWAPLDLAPLIVRRARRQYRVPVTHTPLTERSGFTETILGYTPEEAMAEASRCLDCHLMCSLCVGVCPNLALMTYQVDPVKLSVPSLSVRNGGVEVVGVEEFRVNQRPQIAVLTDFCNECGNCVTACPTSGRPYVDKPRLYLHRGDFEAQSDNAFMLFAGEDGAAIESRRGGETHRLVLNGRLEYTAPQVGAVLDPDTLAVLRAAPGPAAAEGEVVSLAAAAEMLVLLRGLRSSMPQVPARAASPGTRVAHPGYAE
jgi:putative selenate reductase